jgi:Tol biopolymer transport system component
VGHFSRANPVTFSIAPKRLSPDGRWLAWCDLLDGAPISYVTPVVEPGSREVCRGCVPVAFLSDAAELLVKRRRSLARVRLAEGGKETSGAELGEEVLLDAGVSPDERWVALTTGRPDGSTVLRLLGLARALDSPGQGTEIAGGKGWVGSPRFSHDGRFLYYLSDRDGFNCVWAVPLDPRTGRTAAGP